MPPPSGRRRKGTFTPLKAIVSRLGAAWLVELQPGVLAASLGALEDDGACQAATAFLGELLKTLLMEMRADGGVFFPRFFHSKQ